MHITIDFIFLSYFSYYFDFTSHFYENNIIYIINKLFLKEKIFNLQ